MATSSPARKTASPATLPKQAPPHAKAAAKVTTVNAPAAAAKASPVKTAAAKPMAVKGDKKKDKTEKVKVVRDSFTIPKAEYAQIAALKKRAMDLGQEVKKSELLRAGLLLLTSASDATLRKALDNVPTLKTGRPGKA